MENLPPAASSRILMLPVEITTEIFLFDFGASLGLDDRDPPGWRFAGWTEKGESRAITLSAVCSQWRSIARSCPALWTHMGLYFSSEIKPNLQLEKIAAFLQLSGDMPLSVEIEADQEDLPRAPLKSLKKLLTPHMQRCYSVQFKGSIRFARVFFPLRGDTRGLRSLEVNCCSWGGNEVGTLKLVENNFCPPLVNFSLNINGQLGKNRQFFDWTKLERLQLSSDRRAGNVSELPGVLATCARLRTLAASAGVLSVSLSQPVELPALASLFLWGSFPSILNPPIISPRLVDLTLRVQQLIDVERFDLLSLSRFPTLKSVTLESSFSLVAPLARAMTSLLQFLWFHSTIESLNLDELPSNGSESLCLLHHLSSIDVDTTCRHSLRDWAPRHPLYNPQSPAIPAFLPNLKTLSIGNLISLDYKKIPGMETRLTSALSSPDRSDMRIVLPLSPDQQKAPSAGTGHAMRVFQRAANSFPGRVLVRKQAWSDATPLEAASFEGEIGWV